MHALTSHVACYAKSVCFALFLFVGQYAWSVLSWTDSTVQIRAIQKRLEFVSAPAHVCHTETIILFFTAVSWWCFRWLLPYPTNQCWRPVNLFCFARLCFRRTWTIISDSSEFLNWPWHSLPDQHSRCIYGHLNVFSVSIKPEASYLVTHSNEKNRDKWEIETASISSSGPGNPKLHISFIWFWHFLLCNNI